MKEIAIVRVFFFPYFLEKLSFKLINQERDVDLLLVDSGDLHDGVFVDLRREIRL